MKLLSNILTTEARVGLTSLWEDSKFDMDTVTQKLVDMDVVFGMFNCHEITTMVSARDGMYQYRSADVRIREDELFNGHYTQQDEIDDPLTMRGVAVRLIWNTTYLMQVNEGPKVHLENQYIIWEPGCVDNRKSRLQRLVDLGAPDIIIEAEERIIASLEIVDELFSGQWDNILEQCESLPPQQSHRYSHAPTTINNNKHYRQTYETVKAAQEAM